MVTMRAERHGRRARKVYAITPKGREYFLCTLREPAQPIFVYDEAQVKIYFAHHDPETALQHVERERRFAGAWGTFLERLLEDMKSHGASPFRTSMVADGPAGTRAPQRRAHSEGIAQSSTRSKSRRPRS
jgi:hypothetical protein